MAQQTQSSTLPTDSRETSLRVAAESLGLTYAPSLSAYPTSADFVAKVPISFARQHGILGLVGAQDQLLIAFSDPGQWDQVDVVARFLARRVGRLLAPAEAVAAAINEAYQQRTGQAQEAIEKLDSKAVLEEVSQLANREDLLDVSSRAPVIKLVNLILFEAVKAQASDIHLQPYEERLIVRMRLDGILYNSFELPKTVQEEVLSRVKVMGRMNIAEKRLPQDGRATVQVGDRTIDLRIASLPTSHGERIVIRLLDKSARLYRLGELGMGPRTLVRFREVISNEHGLVLVTGPTGSGKTTTLYAALKELDRTERNVLTLEDPIEYQLDGISQTQISDKKGMTFASGLRSVLRQDPDIIMVGEIRDRETATMAIQAALTGHLVFSTLHTNDAASAVTRLLDLGIEPYLVASSLVGVLAQRLVRRVCSACSLPHAASPEDRRWLGVSDAVRLESLRQGSGCEVCRQTGYKGRLGIFELLATDDSIRHLIQSRATASQIKVAAGEAAMGSLREDGVRKVMDGLTTITEVERVTIRAGGEERGADLEPGGSAGTVA